MMKPTKYSIPADHFKAKCLQLMDEVKEKHINIIITKHGKPIAKLVPINDMPVNVFGCLKNSVTINGDIINPLNVNWEAQI